MLSSSILEASLVVQWVGLGAANTEDASSVPGQGTRILHAIWHSQKWKIIITENFKKILKQPVYSKFSKIFVNLGLLSD